MGEWFETDKIWVPAIDELPGDATSGSWKNFRTGMQKISQKLWRDFWINAVSDHELSESGTAAANTTALDNARDALTSGGTVYIPKGTYDLTYLKMKDNIHYQGAGPDATILVHKGSGSFVQNNDPTSTLEYASISNLTLKAHANTDYLIHLVRCMRNSFNHLRLDGDKAGSGKATAVGIYLAGATGNGVYYNEFLDIIVNYMGGDGIKIASTSGTTTNANWFHGLRTQHNDGDGIEIGDAQGNEFSGFSSESNGGYGINVSDSSGYYNQFHSGWIENNTTGSIRDTAGRNVYFVSVGQSPPAATLERANNIMSVNTDYHINKLAYLRGNASFERTTSGATAFQVKVDGDSQSRMLTTAGGKVYQGAGSAAPGLALDLAGDNGELCSIKRATTELTGLNGATATWTNGIPASGVLVFGVTARVTTAIQGATSWDIGDGTDVDRWGLQIAIALGSTSDMANFQITSPVYYTAATNVVLTANGGAFTAGAVRLTLYYMELTKPTG